MPRFGRLRASSAILHQYHASGIGLNANPVIDRVIRPALKQAGLEWHGWHAFRRELATNLYRLGVPDKTIQAILRHANPSTTMNAYVKSVPADATAAMKAFEDLCNQDATAAEQAHSAVM